MAKTQKTVDNSEAPKFKRGAALVVPSLSIADMVEGDSLFVKFVTEPVTRDQTVLSGADKGKTKIDPETGEPLTITTAQVIDLTTGALGDLVLSYMVVKGLTPYAEQHGGVVGHAFEFVKGKKKGRTIMWEVYSIEP